MKNEKKEYARPTLRKIDAVTATTLLEAAVEAGNAEAREVMRVRQGQQFVAQTTPSNNDL